MMRYLIFAGLWSLLHTNAEGIEFLNLTLDFSDNVSSVPTLEIEFSLKNRAANASLSVLEILLASKLTSLSNFMEIGRGILRPDKTINATLVRLGDLRVEKTSPTSYSNGNNYRSSLLPLTTWIRAHTPGTPYRISLKAISTDNETTSWEDFIFYTTPMPPNTFQIYPTKESLKFTYSAASYHDGLLLTTENRSPLNLAETFTFNHTSKSIYSLNKTYYGNPWLFTIYLTVSSAPSSGYLLSQSQHIQYNGTWYQETLTEIDFWAVDTVAKTLKFGLSFIANTLLTDGGILHIDISIILQATNQSSSNETMASYRYKQENMSLMMLDGNQAKYELQQEFNNFTIITGRTYILKAKITAFDHVQLQDVLTTSIQTAPVAVAEVHILTYYPYPQLTCVNSEKNYFDHLEVWLTPVARGVSQTFSFGNVTDCGTFKIRSKLGQGLVSFVVYTLSGGYRSDKFTNITIDVPPMMPTDFQLYPTENDIKLTYSTRTFHNQFKLEMRKQNMANETKVFLFTDINRTIYTINETFSGNSTNFTLYLMVPSTNGSYTLVSEGLTKTYSGSRRYELLSQVDLRVKAGEGNRLKVELSFVADTFLTEGGISKVIFQVYRKTGLDTSSDERIDSFTYINSSMVVSDVMVAKRRYELFERTWTDLFLTAGREYIVEARMTTVANQQLPDVFRKSLKLAPLPLAMVEVVSYFPDVQFACIDADSNYFDNLHVRVQPAESSVYQSYNFVNVNSCRVFATNATASKGLNLVSVYTSANGLQSRTSTNATFNLQYFEDPQLTLATDHDFNVLISVRVSIKSSLPELHFIDVQLKEGNTRVAHSGQALNDSRLKSEVINVTHVGSRFRVYTVNQHHLIRGTPGKSYSAIVVFQNRRGETSINDYQLVLSSLPPFNVTINYTFPDINIMCVDARPNQYDQIEVGLQKEGALISTTYKFDTSECKPLTISGTFRRNYVLSVYTISSGVRSSNATEVVYRPAIIRNIFRESKASLKFSEDLKLQLTASIVTNVLVGELKYLEIKVFKHDIGTNHSDSPYLDFTLTSENLNFTELEDFDVKYQIADLSLSSFLYGKAYTVAVSYTNERGEKSDTDELTQFLAPLPLENVTLIYSYPDIAFTYQINKLSYHDSIEVGVKDEGTQLHSRYVVQEVKSNLVSITGIFYTLDQQIIIHTLAGGQRSETGTQLEYHTNLVTISAPNITYENKIFQITTSYQTENFAYATLHIRHTKMTTWKSFNIGHRTNAHVPLSNLQGAIQTGTFRIYISTTNGKLISTSRITTFINDPYPPRNINVSTTTNQATLTWLAPETAYTYIVINCVNQTGCGRNKHYIVQAGKNTFRSNNDLPSGYAVHFTIAAVYQEVFNLLTSPYVRVIANMETAPLRHLRVGYIPVANTSLISTTNFSIYVTRYLKSIATFSQLKIEVFHINRVNSSQKLLITKIYPENVFITRRKEIIIFLQHHPIPGAMYRVIATVYGLPGKATPKSSKRINIPPAPPRYFSLLSVPDDPLLMFEWLPAFGIQDKFILKICLERRPHQCIDSVIWNTSVTSFRYKRTLLPSVYVAHIIAQSAGYNSTGSQRVVVRIGNPCAHPGGLNGQILNTNKDDDYYFESGKDYSITCFDGYRIKGIKKFKWICDKGKWRNGSSCVAKVSLVVVVAWTTAALFTAIFLIGAGFLIWQFSRNRQRMRKMLGADRRLTLKHTRIKD